MRFKLRLYIDKKVFGDLIPFNYMYECSSVIYKILARSDEAFATWLHENGFSSASKRFKLFTFSRIYIPEFQVRGSFLKILSDTIEWQISFLPERSTLEFIQGVFREQEFEIGNRRAKIRCRVQSIEKILPPTFSETMKFETLSPVCIPFKSDDGTVKYISPAFSEALLILKNNLLSKYSAMYGEVFSEKEFPFSLQLLSTPKPVLITIRSKIRNTRRKQAERIYVSL